MIVYALNGLSVMFKQYLGIHCSSNGVQHIIVVDFPVMGWDGMESFVQVLWCNDRDVVAPSPFGGTGH